MFTLNPGAEGLQAGDAVSFGLFSLSPAPRCDLLITGAGVPGEAAG